MMAQHETIAAYIAALPSPLREVADETRRIIDDALNEATSSNKWAEPVWCQGKEPICYLKAAAHHVTLGFWRGAAIQDPSGRLESSGERMAHVKLRGPADLDAELFTGWLQQARDLALAALEQARRS